MTVLRTLPEALAARLAGVPAATIAADLEAWRVQQLEPPRWPLAGLAGAWVYLDRVAPLTRDDCPAVLIAPASLELAPEGMTIDGGQFGGDVSLELVLMSRGDPASLAGEALLQAVLARLQADPSLGGTVLALRMDGLRVSVEAADATVRRLALELVAQVALDAVTLEILP